MKRIKLLTSCFIGFLLTTTFLLRTNAQPFGNVAIGGGGFVSGIITCKTKPNLIYLRTDVGGAYRWDTINKSWIPLQDWVSADQTGYLGIESLAVDPSNPNNLYMLMGISYFQNGQTAIYRSSDQGKTFSLTDVTSQFKAHGNGYGRNTGEKLVVDPNLGSILFCGSRYNGLFKSVNSGVSWSHIAGLSVTTTANNGNGISFVVFDPSSGTTGSATQTIFVGVSALNTTNLYKSTDGGVTFSAVSGAINALMPERAVWAGDTSLYITYANGAGPGGTSAEATDVGQIWKYKISTGKWTNITPSGFSRAFCGISVDPNNPQRVVASSTNTYWAQGNTWGDQIFLTTNGGTSWVNKTASGYKFDPNGITWALNGQSIHWAGSIEFDPFNTKRVYVVSGNGLFTTENIDSTTNVWKFNVNGLEETVPLDMISIPNGPIISAIGDYDGFRQTDPLKYGPINSPTMGTTNSVAYAALNPKYVARVGSSIYCSGNMGVSYSKAPVTNGSQGYVSLSADGKVLLHSPGGSSITYRSLNYGTSWTTVTGLSYSDARTVADQVNVNKFYAYNPSSGAFYVSSNGGVSFASTVNIGASGSKHIRTVPGYEGHIWVALYGGGLTRSVNSGQSFTKISNVTYCASVGLGKAAPGKTYPTIYIWGSISYGAQGLYRSTDLGTSWTRINDNDHEWGGPGNGQFVVGDMNVYGRVFMSTAGRGIVLAQLQDCNGVWGGTAYLDSCQTCVEGTTGKHPCVKDCQGIWGGSDTLSCSKDCHGIWGGGAFIDSCGTCVGGSTGKQACIKDCSGVWGGKAYLDSCSICVGGTTGKTACTKDCNGVWGGTAYKDNCNNCVGGNTGKLACVKDCNNVWGGTAYLDSCQTCVGGTTGKLACAKDCKGAWGGSAFIDDCANCIDTTKGEKACNTAINTQTTTAFSFTPNPFVTSLKLQANYSFEYSIYDIQSKLMETGTCTQQCYVGSNLMPGFYLLTIKTRDDVKIFKIEKQQ